jgi:dTDP-4-dehydrorhamnose 3,5-epimerase
VRDGLPEGGRLIDLDTHLDDRGGLTELFRRSWGTGPIPAQWNVSVSRAGVLRGVHVHLRRTDYLVVVRGRGDIGLRDVRRGSPTEGLALLVELREDRPRALIIPPGVLHGFHFPVPSETVVGFSEEHEPEDDLACHWADPRIGIPWRSNRVVLSDRDRGAPPLSDLLAELEPYQPIGSCVPGGASAAATP